MILFILKIKGVGSNGKSWFKPQFCLMNIIKKYLIKIIKFNNSGQKDIIKEISGKPIENRPDINAKNFSLRGF